MGELPEDIVAASQRFQQGDLVEGLLLVEVADLSRPLSKAAQATRAKWEEAGRELKVAPVNVSTPYCCIVSQTCDVISPADSRPSIKVAQVTAHDDPAEIVGTSNKKVVRRQKREQRIQAYKDGKFIQLVHLNIPDAAFPAGGFVDLASITTVEKTLLVGKEPIRPLITPDERRAFAFRAAHIYERPAIPFPFDDLVVRPLRNFLAALKIDDSKTFDQLESEIEDEWLWLDDEDNPKVGTLYFVGDNEPSASTKKVLDDWWEEIQEKLPDDCALTANEYKPLAEVSMAKGKAMSLLTYWHLSEDLSDHPTE